jgi:hypothetical protein
MDGPESFVNELVGKTVLVKTHMGAGTKDVRLSTGEYKGVLLGFDGKFLKLEYDINKFTEGNNLVTKDLILINAAYIITINEYKGKDI